jgi:hypothetical protein
MRLINEEQALAQDEIIRFFKAFPINLLKIYPRSFCSKNGLWYGLIRTSEGKKLVVWGERSRVLKDACKGNCHHQLSSLKVCNLSAENTESLMDLFPYTKPVSLRKYPMTIGTGDRVGLATPGHIRAIKKFQIYPVLAQQSVIENGQTGRDFIKVIQDAAWAVFQENYREGYGADGDHLRSLQEVKSALDAGVSMVTLDLSDRIDANALQEPKELIDAKFKEEIDEGDAQVVFHLFLDKEFIFKGTEGQFSIQFNQESVKRNTLLFYKALDFTEEVYEWIRFRKRNQGSIDFEISMDETPFPTSPENHFFFALELSHRGVHIQSLAPRFTGEFQEGIDCRGAREAFRRQFYQHVLIAQDYGNYKISVHSGSDKFSVFPDVGELSKGFLHLKTSGTSWLEAMRLIATGNPNLYREMHSFAVSRFEEASKLYHVSTDLSRIPNTEELSDEELPALLDQEDSRQLLHVTYGYLLNAKDGAGRNLFRDQLTHTLTQYEEDYWSMLETYIEKHLSSLGVERSKVNRYPRTKKEKQERGSKKNG